VAVTDVMRVALAPLNMTLVGNVSFTSIDFPYQFEDAIQATEVAEQEIVQ